MAKKKFAEAFALAKEARLRAYAPYSKFLVGAALVGKSGKLYPGCNVENASFGATICAERSAIVSAISQGEQKFQAIVLVTDPQAVPCGQCLQMLAEFFGGKTPIILSDTKGQQKESCLDELLPQRFDFKK